MPLEAELDGLGRELLAALRAHPEEFGPPRGCAPPPRPGLARLPDFVLESETGLVLGEPPARSLSLAVPVFGPVADAVWSFGPAFVEARAPRDFLQLLVVEAPPPASRVLLSRLGSLRSLARRLPGYFAHSAGNGTSARIHRGLLAEGFSAERLAAQLRAQLRDEGYCAGAAVAVGTPSARALELVAPFAARLDAIRESLAAARAQAAAREGCAGQDCRACDEREICDKVRAVLASDRRAATAKGASEP